MKKLISMLALASVLWMSFSSVQAEEVSGYQFQDNWMVGIKSERISDEDKEAFELDASSTYFLVSVALRALDSSTIDKIDAKIEMDTETFEVENPDDNIIDGDIFTSVDSKGYNTENGFVEFVATTDSYYESTEPNEAFGFITKVKKENTNEISALKISDINFKISSPEDDLTNLFTDTLELELTDLPVSEVEVEIVEEPVIKTVEEEPEVELVKEDVEKPETWANDIALAIVLLALLGLSVVVLRKEA